MTYKELKIEECKKTYPYCGECSQYYRCGIRITLFGDLWEDKEENDNGSTD